MDAFRGVDVVVVAYNSARNIERCIRSVRRWDEHARVIVVDNASSDDSALVAERFADRVIRSTTNRGFGAAQNMGLSAGDRDWLLMLNPDAEVISEGLDGGIEALSADPGVAMVQGVIRTMDGGVERWCGDEPGLRALIARALKLRERIGVTSLQRLARLFGRRDYADRIPAVATSVEFLAAVAPLARRTALAEVGGFDDEIFLYAEDVDLCRRLRAHGWTLRALPLEWATHVGGASSADQPALRERAWWESHRVLVQKHWTGPRRWLGLAVTGRQLRRARSRA